MAATATKEMTTQADSRRPDHNVPAIAGPRLPYHPAIGERFGIDKASWKALVEAIFPNASTVESVILALSYCRARKLDPFKRNVHIVPIWNKDLGRLIDTIWPGIGELRTTAFRTGEYAGRGETVYGPDLTQKVGSVEITFPEWAQVTVKRMVKGQLVEFCGPRVYWLETYATTKRNDDTPNEMWQTRPRGQIDKCAEAAALRAGFPEEVGGDYIPEEVQHPRHTPAIEGKATESLDDLADKLAGPVAEAEPEVTDAGERPQTTAEPRADFLELADMDLKAALTPEAIDQAEESLLQKAENEAECNAVSGMASVRREKLRELAGTKGKGQQKSLAGT